MSKKLDFAEDLIDYIHNSPSMFHAVEETKKLLVSKGFKELDLKETWKLDKGGEYFTIKNDSSIVAFRVGTEDLAESGFRILGAHTDSPTFRIKPSPEIKVENSYLKLNTEVYGGPILNTWFDRPLSIAGRVTVMTDNPLKPESHLVDFKKPITIIPNLAIHMNREVNTGFNINPQKHTLPLLSMINDKFEEEGFLLELLADELDVKAEEILDFEIYLYDVEKGKIIGLNDEFISVGKLDNLAMVHAGIHGLIDSEGTNATNIVMAFDNEEVGSQTKQGAGSPVFKSILKRINIALGGNEEDYYRALENSFMLSADQAHAIHPNFTEKCDITNKPIINRGPTIKIAANQAYTTDSESSAVFEGICRKLDLPVQKFVNRSDMRGGSTIGPISSSQIPISSVDIGNPILAMHSIRELGGVDDHYYVYKVLEEYFNL